MVGGVKVGGVGGVTVRGGRGGQGDGEGWKRTVIR